jgi:hypothetical protein
MGPDFEAPKWEAIQEETCCPLCDYNLRGLIEPRCPECGYSFAWPDLLDPSRRLHPYLFEHHPERRLWSFRRTLAAGLRPRRFWKALHPAQPSYPRRLILYWALAVLPMLLTAAANVGGLAISIRRENLPARASEKALLTNPRYAAIFRSTIQQYGSLDKYLDKFYPVDWRLVFRATFAYGESLVGLCLPALFTIAWPWLTLFALMIFQISMRRARVRGAHILRCTCYSSDIGFWLGLAIIPVALIWAWVQPTTITGSGRFLRTVSYEFYGCILALLVFNYRLLIAYRSYLRFPRSIAVIVATQIIAFLALLTLLILTMLLFTEQ